MSPAPQLSAPGSSIYSSGTMFVGDGTWDSQRNTFLLPNLQGLNFNTMRYNGMGNRFRDLDGYHSLIRGHGVLAAITFLGLVPAAIMIARFYTRNPRLALRLHIWLQSLTILLATVIFVLGWIAVGPKRSLTNPHHGVGLAIYVMLWFQFLFGAFIHRTEKGKMRYRVPFKLYLHQWVGRAVALLGLAQVPLGLTLYGSPKALFIVYAIIVLILLVIYFVLSYRSRPDFFDDGTTYFSGSRTDYTEEEERKSHRHGRLGALAAAGAAGAGLAALRRRSRSRHRQDEVISSHHGSRPASGMHSESFIDEKIDHSPQKHTWRDRLVGAGAAVGALAVAKRLFGGKEDKHSNVGSGRYAHPLGGAHSVSHTDISAVEEGRPPVSPEDGRHHHHRPGAAAAIPLAAGAAALGSPSRSHRRRSRRSGDSIHSSSLMSEQTPKKTHTARNTLAALGVAGFLRHKWNERKDRKEDQRVEDERIHEEMEQERINRANNRRRRYTGDGNPPRRTNTGRTGRTTTTVTDDLHGSNPELSLSHLPRPGTAAAESTSQIPPRSTAQSLATAPSATAGASVPALGTTPIPPPPPLHDPFLPDSSGSEAYFSSGGRQHHRHKGIAGTAAAAGLGAAAGAAAASRPGPPRRDSNTDSVTSPPVSVKVKMHKDGRHVTLRRLGEAEAAAEREARRRERRRRGSISSASDAAEPSRYRRQHLAASSDPVPGSSVSALEATSGPIPMPEPPPQVEGYPQIPTGVPPHNIPGPPPGPPPAAGPSGHIPGPPPPPPPLQTQHYNPSPISTLSGMPPPPPIPGAASGVTGSGVTGPYDTGTESNYDNNRRRRRAERAQAKLAAAQRSGSKVEFT